MCKKSTDVLENKLLPFPVLWRIPSPNVLSNSSFFSIGNTFLQKEI